MELPVKESNRVSAPQPEAQLATTPAGAVMGPDRTHVFSDRPVAVHFGFEDRQSRVGAFYSVAAHVAFAVIALVVIYYAPAADPLELLPDQPPKQIVWLAIPGPGGGGGGGGNKAPDPPRKTELPGREKITVPVQKPAVVIPKPEDPPPLETINIPALNMAAAQQPVVGVMESPAITESQGAGANGGAGTGTGTGIGPGQGSGLGPGYGGGFGGGAYRQGAGITLPVVLKEVRPQYTADAMRAKVQGAVWLECIVMPDGSVGDVRVTRSLDPVFGLDQEAIKAAKQWRFRPGSRQGEPVPVIVTIELSFTLR
jgi:TonB family protein